MTRWAVAGCMALAALGAVTALDVGSRAAEAAANVSPFAGSWSGTWAIAERGLVGTFDWTISDAGRITGTLYHTTGGFGGTMTGRVGADGDLMFIGMTPSDTPSNGTNGVPFMGTAVIDDDGDLVVSADGTDSSGPALVATLERI